MIARRSSLQSLDKSIECYCATAHCDYQIDSSSSISSSSTTRSAPILCPVSKKLEINDGPIVNEALEHHYNQMSWMMYQRIMDSRLKRASNQTVLVGGNNENFREDESTMKIIENASKVNDKFQDSVGAALDNFNSEDDDDQGIFDIDMD